MIYLLDTNQELDECANDLKCEVGQLLTPLTRRKYESGTFAIDNGAFANFNADGFRSLLNRVKDHRQHCKFVAAPDVVGAARRTLEVFDHWYPELAMWPIALVAQDGQEDLPIPWRLISAIFIGGSTEWKLSNDAMAICKAAKAMGKWVHIGRVNTPNRMERFLDVADSVDGTGLSRYTHMRKNMAEGLPLLDPK